jgi:hypothetical protein
VYRERQLNGTVFRMKPQNRESMSQ